MMAYDDLRTTLRNQGQFEFLFAAILAMLLLSVWAGVTVWMIVLSITDDCVIGGGKNTDFCPTSGAVDLHNVLFGLVSAMVLVELAVTPRGRDPSDRLITKVYRKFPRDGCLRRMVVWTPAFFLGAWLFFGLITLVFGVIATDEGGALRTTGFAWLGFAVASFYSYFGTSHDEVDLAETIAAANGMPITAGTAFQAIPENDRDMEEGDESDVYLDEAPDELQT